MDLRQTALFLPMGYFSAWCLEGFVAPQTTALLFVV
jgi:hypothetical protein